MPNLVQVAEQIIDLSQKMRFIAIIDLKGNIVEGIMKKGKTSLESQKENEYFCKQVARRRQMRKEFDKNLGKVRYVHVERAKVTQLVVYTKRYTFFVTVEPELNIVKKLEIVNKIKKIISGNSF
jgi:lipopolysaccharide export LptBFGC system permease protein LptF